MPYVSNLTVLFELAWFHIKVLRYHVPSKDVGGTYILTAKTNVFTLIKPFLPVRGRYVIKGKSV